MTQCRHQRRGICLNLKVANTNALPHVCAACAHYDGPMRGLGDAVAAVTKATGIDTVVRAVTGSRGCGCASRREKLNAALPFKPPLDGDR